MWVDTRIVSNRFNRSFLKFFQRLIITVITQPVFCGKTYYSIYKQYVVIMIRLVTGSREACGEVTGEMWTSWFRVEAQSYAWIDTGFSHRA